MLSSMGGEREKREEITGKGAQKENRETGNEIIMIPKLKRGIELSTGMVEHRMQRFR